MPWLTYDPPPGSVTRAEIDYRCKSRRSTNATRADQIAYARRTSTAIERTIVCGADTTKPQIHG
jgi:hypothetical protein